jgi:drug/metabolite transporter (DMT)-like permease
MTRLPKWGKIWKHFAIVYARKNLGGLPALVTPTAQLAIAALLLLPLSLVVEQPYALPWPSQPAISSLLALVVVSTALPFVLYYRIMERASATHLSMVTYLIPIVGTLLGVVVLYEQLGWTAYLGCLLVILGVMAVNGSFQTWRWRWLALRFVEHRQ